MARWLSWLERRPVTAEVDGSNPFRVVSLWAFIMDGFPSGQRGQTVNLLSLTSVVRIHLHPLRHLSLIYIRGLSSAGRASALQAEGHRFEPYRSHFTQYADVAQLAEQLICNQQVIGSSPIIGFCCA